MKSSHGNLRPLFLAFISLLVWGCSKGADSKVITLTDALEDGAWEVSEWISVKEAPVYQGRVTGDARAADGASWFLSRPTNSGKVVSARWMTSGLGVYELYVNGQVVGQEALKPGFTHYAKTKRSFTYDVTSLINKGKGEENQLSVQVTPGWWGDKIITPEGIDGMIGRKCAFRGVLELVYDDGKRELLGTDTKNWKAGIAGPVLHAAIFDGEIYDARIPLGYETPEKLSEPEVNHEFQGEILPTSGAEIYYREDLAMSPVRSYIWKDANGATEDEYGKVAILREFSPGETMVLLPGETLVVDFGQNAAAVPDFVFSAAEGTTLRCEVSELLNDGNGSKARGMDGPEGSVHRLNLRIPDTGMYLTYTFADDKDVHYRPRSTFFGYRLVSITASEKVSIRSLRSVPVTSIKESLETGTLATGNDLINKLISNTIWGQRSNYLSVPTDCPQRNERLGWTADTQVFTRTGTFFANTNRFFHKWLRDMRDTQSPLGGYPGVAPIAQYGCFESDMMRVGWADAGIIVPWTIWRQYGDDEIVDESWASMELFMDHIASTRYDHQALSKENGNYQWADWLSYEPLESCSGRSHGPSGPLPETLEYWSFLSGSYWAMDATMMYEMARATGRDEGKYKTMADDAKAYLRERFLTPDGTFKVEILNTMQTPQLFVLKNELLEGEAREGVIRRLRKNFLEHDNCLQTGFLGTSILMSTLSQNGMSDIAYELLFQRKNPSWLYSVDNGATTIWERWNSYTLDGGMGPQGMNSFNHYAYGVVCEWIWETAAGIASDPKAPGFRHIIMRPVPDRRLGHLDAVYESQAGVIESHWRYEGDKWIWNFTIPRGATASVFLPGSMDSTEYQEGSYTVEMAS